MITTGILVAVTAVPAVLPGQGSGTGGRNSVPSFDQLAREVLVVRLQAESIRGSVAVLLRGQSGSAPDVRTTAWNDSVQAAQSNLETVERDLRRIGKAFRDARHRRGLRLIAEIDPLLAKSRSALQELSRAEDGRVARTAITHLIAALEALLQRIDEGKTCCRLAAQLY